MDPYADSGMVEEMYGLKLKSEPCAPYDLIIVAVAHDCYASLDDEYFRSIARNENTLSLVAPTCLVIWSSRM